MCSALLVLGLFSPTAAGAAAPSLLAADLIPPPLTVHHKRVVPVSERIEHQADRIDRARLPFQLGGGHVVGKIPGPRSTSYDCSGAVSRVLQAGGVKGIHATFTAAGFVALGKPGLGKVTVFYNNDHSFVKILGRYFGTSHSNPGGGPGWFKPTAAYRAGFGTRIVPLG